MPSMTPEQVKESLTLDQYKLYKLVWERFTASQMADALLDTVSASIGCGDYTFKASGYSVRFDGFTALYEESKDVPEEKSPALPSCWRVRRSNVAISSQTSTSPSRLHVTPRLPSSRHWRKTESVVRAPMRRR